MLTTQDPHCFKASDRQSLGTCIFIVDDPIAVDLYEAKAFVCCLSQVFTLLSNLLTKLKVSLYN